MNDRAKGAIEALSWAGCMARQNQDIRVSMSTRRGSIVDAVTAFLTQSNHLSSHWLHTICLGFRVVA